MPLSIQLFGPVGSGGLNRHFDVVKIQTHLNWLPSLTGGADPKLKVDGIVGPKTIAAIRQFQSVQNAIQDGRIEEPAPDQSEAVFRTSRLGRRSIGL